MAPRRDSKCTSEATLRCDTDGSSDEPADDAAESDLMEIIYSFTRKHFITDSCEPPVGDSRVLHFQMKRQNST